MDATEKPWRVVVIESERGWGPKIDSIERFATEAEALEYQAEFNRQNSSPTAPDWYMQAQDPECVTASR